MAQRKDQTPKGPERDIDDPEAVRASIEEQAKQREKALRDFALPMTVEPAFAFRPLE